jgi:hypothetical protein
MVDGAMGKSTREMAVYWGEHALNLVGALKSMVPVPAIPGVSSMTLTDMLSPGANAAEVARV